MNTNKIAGEYRKNMPQNQLVLLDALVAERKNTQQDEMDDATFFELFASEQALKNFDLSDEEIIDGLVGGGQDGGIDSAYVLLDNLVLAEDHEIFNSATANVMIPRQAHLELVLVQAKRTAGFNESTLVTVKATLEDLLDLEKEEKSLRAVYNTRLVDKAMLFRNALIKLASRHPRTSIRFTYASRGNVNDIGDGVNARAEQLRNCLEQFSDNSKVEFLGAGELWKAANLVKTYTLKLPYSENVTLGTSYAALVTLKDYLAFITDENSDLRRYIFEMNVRDYQGDVEVNNNIADTLQDVSAPEFWWLNNGVTIICSHATLVGKEFNLDDVQIVNGLQTSFTLYETYKNSKKADPVEIDSRHVLVRILVTSDVAIRDQVIRATNSQTSVPTASLRATDDLQREIETYLAQHDWYYDRRKNFYKNTGKQRDRIIGIPYLAQAVIAAGLSEPNQARARPSSLLKNDNDYKSIFDVNLDLSVYLYCLELQKAVDNFLTAHATGPDERSNLRFHLTTLVSWRLLGRIARNPSQLTDLSRGEHAFSELILRAAYEELVEWREAFIADTNITSSDQVSKNAKFVDYMKTRSSLE